jgi:uncharacterized protein YegJ (DUF2314 family)
MRISAALAIILLHLSCLAQKPLDVAASDKAMNEAIARAKASVHRVQLELERGNTHVSVKVPIVEGAAVEHFWLREVTFNRKTAQFSGLIDNDPGFVKNVKIGQSLTVSATQISDWLYMREGRMHGNFTIRVLLPRMPAAEAQWWHAKLSAEP